MKRNLRNWMVLLLVGIMVLSMTGCSQTKKAEKAVENMLDALQNYDLERAQEYMDVEAMEESVGSDDESSEEFMRIIFEDMEYEILSSEQIDDETVEVSVEVTTIDMTKFMQSYFAKALEFAFSNLDATDEETEAKMEELMQECLEDTRDERITQEAVATVVKGDDGWKVESDDALINAMLGGLPEATKNLEANFGE